MSSPTIEDLWQAACAVQKRAYAPYSGYSVGAALSLQGDDRIFSGCNVENASYGATMCAERNAIFQAVAATDGKPLIEHLVLVTKTPAAPCGLCLQVISEFSSEDTRITIATPEAFQPDVPLSYFLPNPFSPSSLSDHV